MRHLTFGFLVIFTALIVSVVAFCFDWLIEGVTNVAFGKQSGDFISYVESLSVLERLLIPTFGGLVVGLIFTVTKQLDVVGEGVPAVIRAITFGHSKISKFTAPIKMIASAITLGTGGSAGREGPVVQIGSSIGSGIAQRFKRSEVDTNVLLACGATAGISATFGAPLMGVFFSLELLLKRRTWWAIVCLVASAYAAHMLSVYALGHSGLPIIFTTPERLDVMTFVFSIVLGMMAGLLAVFLGQFLNLFRTVVKKYQLTHLITVPAGGFLIGCIGLIAPFIHEPATYEVISETFTQNETTLAFVAFMIVAKMVATSITLGSGGSGGIFAPALLLGSLLGVVTVGFSNILGVVTNQTLLSLAGIAAVFGAITHAPVTAVVMVSELSQSLFVLPIAIISTAISYGAAKALHGHSVYEKHKEVEREVEPERM